MEIGCKKQRVHVIKQRNVHTDREQDVYYWEQQDEADFQNHNVPLSRQAQRRLLGTLLFFELLADTNCFTTVPRNPLCLPTLFPDNFRLQVPVPLAVPSWMKDFTETCEVYYYEPERYVPTNAASFWSWLFSNTVLGPERMINGLIFLQVVLGGLLLAPAFALEKFGLQYPYMSWLPNLLLILPGGDTPSAQLIVCTATHTYDFLYDAWLAYLFFVIVAPLFTILLAAYASFLALIATQKMRQAARLERARKLIDVGLLSERNAPPLGNLGAGLAPAAMTPSTRCRPSCATTSPRSSRTPSTCLGPPASSSAPTTLMPGRAATPSSCAPSAPPTSTLGASPTSAAAPPTRPPTTRCPTRLLEGSP